MVEVLDSDAFFPDCHSHNVDHIHNESNLTDEWRTYLSTHPVKQRKVGDWVWNAPNKMLRVRDEPAFPVACRWQGMGHYDMLFWYPEDQEWAAFRMGGANGYDSAQRYQKWLAHPGPRFKSTMQECMDMCASNTIQMVNIE